MCASERVRDRSVKVTDSSSTLSLRIARAHLEQRAQHGDAVSDAMPQLAEQEGAAFLSLRRPP